jgi:hypothetical protein
MTDECVHGYLNHRPGAPSHCPTCTKRDDDIALKSPKSAYVIISEAAVLVSGDRAVQHGDMAVVHEHVAAMWGAYLDRTLDSADVARMMVLLKIARSAGGGEYNIDDYVDMAGYSGIAGQLAHR